MSAESWASYLDDTYGMTPDEYKEWKAGAFERGEMPGSRKNDACLEPHKRGPAPGPLGGYD